MDIIANIKKVLDRNGNLKNEIDEYRARDGKFLDGIAAGESADDNQLKVVSSGDELHLTTLVIYNGSSSSVTLLLNEVTEGDSDTVSQIYPDIVVGASDTVYLTEKMVKGVKVSGGKTLSIADSGASAQSSVQVFAGWILAKPEIEI